MARVPIQTGAIRSCAQRALGLMLLAVTFVGFSGCDGSRSPTHTRNLCPDGARFAVADDGRAACVFHRLHLPDSSGLRVVCDELKDGYFSYRWPENAWTVGYRCPMGSVRGMDEDGYASCRFGGLAAPRTNGAGPTCGMTHRGKLGYWWRLDTTASFTDQFGRRLANMSPSSFPAWN